MLYKCHNATCPDRKPAAHDAAPNCYTCGRPMEMTGERQFSTVVGFDPGVGSTGVVVDVRNMRQAAKPIDFRPWPNVPSFKAEVKVEPKPFPHYIQAFTAPHIISLVESFGGTNVTVVDKMEEYKIVVRALFSQEAASVAGECYDALVANCVAGVGVELIADYV